MTARPRWVAHVGRPSIPDELGVEQAVVVTSRFDLTDERVFIRDDWPEVPSRPAGLVTVVTLLAGLRSGLVHATTRHRCNGYNCWRVHGEVGIADALALSCNHFFDELAGRLGSGALGAAFASVGLDVPPIPEERGARIRLATRSEGWMLTPRAALRLAKAMAERAGPWPEVLIKLGY